MGYAKRQLLRRRARRNWLILELVCLLILAVLVAMIAQKLVARRRIAAEESASNRAMQIIVESTSAPAPSSAPVIPLSMRMLLEQNPDTVGMLRFDGDRSFYVCRTDDNVYYMNHRFDGSEDPAGMIYMDYRCELLPRSDNLILYGHNMADGSRFGTLKRFRNEKHLSANPVFTFADLYETVDYAPVAVFTTSVIPDDPAYFPFDCPDFATEDDFNAYIDAIKARSELSLSATPAYGDKLLTLATCSNDHERGRLVIVCYAPASQ